MVSKNKSVKKFTKSGKRLTKKYTKCVEYVKKQGAEVEEPEITEVLLTPEEPEPEPVEEDEPEPEPEPEEPEPEPVEEDEPETEPEEPEEEEIVPSSNDFKFVEPKEFRVQGQLLSGDRVLEIDPLNVVDEPEPAEPVETMEMISDEKEKPEKTTPKKVESATPKKKNKPRGKKTRKRSSNSEKPKMRSLKSK